ncbi:hypothetical protein NX786_27920 [Telluria mixta]|uniref:Uncharacterized protein n=1 Tax=Telluria mixta TaxID=34071 RepID=A0ABT2C706_9BURK|nr:hypothetical protein [Telluria mixta]MCS0633168.1 hypothetical protein [Telluria mixta]WEM94654.1 hypothetical protein P0M04_24620 [Telluria mixta]
MRDHSPAGRLADELASGDVRFTISNGQVTGLEHVIGSRTIAAGPPADATFTVGTGTVTETLTRGTATATLTYTVDADDAGLYHLTQEVRSFDTTAATTPTYGFTVSGGAVTAMTQTFGTSGWAHSVAVGDLAASVFTVEGSTVTETAIRGNTLATLRYTTTDGTTYKLASETLTVVPVGTAQTALDVEPYERMRFTFDGATVSAAQSVKADGTAVDVHLGTTVAYALAAAGYVVETITRGNHSYYEVFHDGNGDGIYTAVAHGQGTTVDLVGLQSQITAQIDALL